MGPLTLLKKAVKAFGKINCRYCLVGGHAASLYRSQERFTKDVDFALAGSSAKESLECAEQCIKLIGLSPVVGFIPPTGAEGPRNSICMVTSQPGRGEIKGMIDILLPELPWVTAAVDRAQHNLIDLGFAHVPVITPEDLVIAKCYALRNAPDRFQDLDDIKEIFTQVQDLDWNYVREGLHSLSLKIPTPLKKFARTR